MCIRDRSTWGEYLTFGFQKMNNLEVEKENTLILEKNDENEPQWKDDIRNLVLLFSLFFTQGLCFGFWGNTLTILMIERKFTFDELAFQSIQEYPFSFKYLLGPIIDTYFSSNFGKK
eukprot:TRINITY_DN24503_c0_g1_i2.p1 TRINITY_DN24503_c0_g1~~TRINITY_DN24503_c0_g1_i2.p1  ORF type:complete len:117 (+),score=21.57 TRINITY_DN24503_c0_g1_i2:63-413(+)